MKSLIWRNLALMLCALVCLNILGFPASADNDTEHAMEVTGQNSAYAVRQDVDAVYEAIADTRLVEREPSTLIRISQDRVAPLSLDGAGVGAATIDRSKWDTNVAPSILSATAFVRDSIKTLSAVTAISGVKRIDDQTTSYRIYFWMDGTTACWWSNAGTVYLPANCNHLFNRAVKNGLTVTYDTCKSMLTLDIQDFDTSKVTDMSYMFYGLIKLTELDVSGFNTSSVTDMSGMFYHCTKVEELDLSGFNTSKVLEMDYMFYYCSGLTALDVSSLNTSNVTTMAWMFNSCTKLKQLDLTTFKTSKVTDMGRIVGSCYALNRLTIPAGFRPSSITATEKLPGYSFAPIYHILNPDGTVSPIVKGSTDINSTTVKTIYIKVCSVTYLANEAESGTVPATAEAMPDEAIEIAGNTGNLQKAGFAFSGWNTAANGTGVDYPVGSSVTPTYNITLYAQWTEANNLSVTIPAALPVSVSANGTVTVSDNLHISNNSSGAVMVTGFSMVDSSTGWTLIAYGQRFHALPVNSNQWGLQINGKDVLTESSEIPETFGTIEPDQTAAVLYGVKVSAATSPMTDAAMAQAVFVVDWAA